MDTFGLFPIGPAYGRKYQRNADVAADWLAGKDFMRATAKAERKHRKGETA